VIRIAAANLGDLKIQLADTGVDLPGLCPVAMAGAAFATLMGFGSNMPADF